MCLPLQLHDRTDVLSKWVMVVERSGRSWRFRGHIRAGFGRQKHDQKCCARASSDRTSSLRADSAAEIPESFHTENLARLREHLLLFLRGVMLDQVPQYLGLGAIGLGIGLGITQFCHREVHKMMLFMSLEEELAILLGRNGFAIGRIENLFLDRRMRFELGRDFLEQLLSCLDASIGCCLELLQELPKVRVIVFQKFDRIRFKHGVASTGTDRRQNSGRQMTTG